MKPYQQIPIVDCGEPLVPIPPQVLALISPHPYVKLGAPYGQRSPFYLRQGVLDRLIHAQTLLQHLHPEWVIQVFDAYRPVAVQQYMVDYSVAEVLHSRGLTSAELTESQRQEVLNLVYQFWAVPNPDPAMPPPHSTGAAVDVTLITQAGVAVEMGSPIDELSPRSYPDHFADRIDPQEQSYHQHRQVLYQVMTQAGFKQHPHEWWHFSYGDQMWAWLMSQEAIGVPVVARYGRVNSEGEAALFPLQHPN